MPARIKVGPIQSLSDARYINALDAENWLTFSFDPLQPDNISADFAVDIIKWLHEPAVVAVFGIQQRPDEIKFITEKTGIKAIEIPDHYSMMSALSELTVFVRHIIQDIDCIPIIDQQEKYYHIIDLSVANISLNDIARHHTAKDWKLLLQRDSVFLRTMAEEYNQSNHLIWQPNGWDIASPKENVTEEIIDLG